MPPGSSVRKRIGLERNARWPVLLERRQVGPSSEAGRAAPVGRGAPCCPAVPSSPHSLWMLQEPTRPSPPTAKTESKFGGRGSSNFLACKFAAEIRRDSVCARERGAVGEEGKGQPAERRPRRNAREGASPSLFLASSLAALDTQFPGGRGRPGCVGGDCTREALGLEKLQKELWERHPPSPAQGSLGPISLTPGEMVRSPFAAAGGGGRSMERGVTYVKL